MVSVYDRPLHHTITRLLRLVGHVLPPLVLQPLVVVVLVLLPLVVLPLVVQVLPLVVLLLHRPD